MQRTMVLLRYPDKSLWSPLTLPLSAGVTSKMMLVYNSRSGEVLLYESLCGRTQALSLFMATCMLQELRQEYLKRQQHFRLSFQCTFWAQNTLRFHLMMALDFEHSLDPHSYDGISCGINHFPPTNKNTFITENVDIHSPNIYV